MLSIKRNQVIVTALVVMVAVAGYLNVQENKLQSADGIVFSDNTDLTGILIPDEGFILDDGTLVDGEIGIALTGSDAVVQVNQVGDPKVNQLADDKETTTKSDSEAANLSDEPGKAVFVDNNLDSSFFVQAKLEREQARSKSKDMLMEMLENKNLEKDQKSECADAVLELQKRIEKESSAEAMIEAKGFKGAYVRIDDQTVDVVVSKEVLSEAEIAQIEDIVKRKTGYSADQIRISTLKNNG